MMKPKIIPIGRIWKSEANGWVYHRGGYHLPSAADNIQEYNQKQ